MSVDLANRVALSLAWLLVCGGVVDAQPAALGNAAQAAPKPALTDAHQSATAARPGFASSVFKTFAEWKQSCDRLPSNRSLRGTLPARGLLPLKSFGEFGQALDAFLELSRAGEMTRTNAWLGEAPTKAGFFNTASAYFLKPPLAFQPFAQRLVIPPGDQVLFHGDFHGDIRSLVAWLDWLQREGYLRDFKLVRPDVYLVLLGDYTDRGLYGIEVLYTILRLKLENPERVVMLRGNHEDVSLAAKYGFLAEGQGKYGRDFNAVRVMRLYDFLPAVLYLGGESDFIQCNHGGMEPGYDPRPLLDAGPEVRFQFLGRIKQRAFVAAHPDWARQLDREGRELVDSSFQDFQPESATVPTVLGFMWNDFTVTSDQASFRLDPGRAFIYGEGPTRSILAQASTPTRRVRAVFRAHQHSSLPNPMMRRLKAGQGVFRHWQQGDSIKLLEADDLRLRSAIEHVEERRLPEASVWTFNVSPDSVYGEGCDFGFDTFGILTTAKTFEEWRLRVVNLTIVR